MKVSSGFVVAKAKVALRLKKNVMTLQELREQLQEDLLTYLEVKGLLQFDHVEIADTVCQIVVDNFKKLETETK